MPFTITWTRRSVIGNKRMVSALGTFTLAGVDTWNPRLRIVEAVQISSNGVNAAGVALAAGVVTFQGAAGPVSVLAIGN